MSLLYIILIINFIIVVITIANILSGNKTPSEKLGWIIVTVLLGVLGVGIYYYLGRKQ